MPMSKKAQAECGFIRKDVYKETKLLFHSTTDAYLFSSDHISIDVDGAPNAYHPDDIGLDFLLNAGYKKSILNSARNLFKKPGWSNVLVPDPKNHRKPFVQTSGEFKGYFLAMTALHDSKKDKTDPARYVDARDIPYIVFPGAFLKKKNVGKVGDLGVAINLSTGEKAPFIVADIGQWDASLGEISIALAEKLGGKKVNPRDGSGVPSDEILYIVFPNSSQTPPWPINAGEIENSVKSLINEVGGFQKILSCQTSL